MRKINSFFNKFLIILVLSTSLCGCNNNNNDMYMAGEFGYQTMSESMKCGVKAQTNTFKADNVSLKFYWGLYEISKDVHLPKKEPDDKVIIAIYICDYKNEEELVNDCEVEDYRNLDNYYFVREISEEEAMSGKYAYKYSYDKGVEYNHYEDITIPERFVNDEKGAFLISIMSYIEPNEEREYYYSLSGCSVWLDYEKTKDGNIEIKTLSKH